MANLEKYQVDHLFVLIGENPLPNYVAAKLLLREGGVVYLVHTIGTKAQAVRLQKILDRELENCQPSQLISLENYESDAYRIQRKILKQVERLEPGKIGMNYTGGTKAMAVHAYRAILQETQNKRQEAIFSYLDPRRLEMCIDREDGDRIAIPIRSQDIAIKLETIFELHGRQFKKDKKSEEIKPNKIPILPNLAKQLATVNQDEAKSTIWFHWLISIFCEGNGDRNQSARKPPKPNGKRGNWKSKTALEQLSFPTNDLPKEIVEEFSKHSFLDKNENLSLKQIKESGCFDNIQDFCEWLDGLWLEYHLLQKIESIASKVGIIDYGMDFQMDLAGTKQGFQFDLAFTYGYQIFAISCTTSHDRSLCKSKLFEAYLRAQQMGGSEARVALLCFAKDIEGIKAEIIDLLSDKQIKIFGREHLDSLDHEIFEWLQENDAELNR